MSERPNKIIWFDFGVQRTIVIGMNVDGVWAVISRRQFLTRTMAATLHFSQEAAPLSGIAAQRGILFGTEVTCANISEDDIYRQLVKSHAAIITPGVEAKWGFVEPSNGNFYFDDLDQLVVFATQSGIALHMHNCIWSVGIPSWTIEELKDGRGRRVIARHISALAGRYRGKVNSWDVVNEPVDPRWPSDPDGLCRTPWRLALGAGYVADVLRETHEADPTARLLINDDDLEYDLPDREAKRSAYLRLIERWLRAGVPIQGFGLEAHLKPWLPLADTAYRRFLHNLAGFGLKLYITELDVCDRTLPADIPLRDRIIANVAERYLRVALDEPAICCVIAWGLSDRYTYMNRDIALRRADGLASRPCPFDAEFRPKPFYHTLAAALHAAPQRPM